MGKKGRKRATVPGTNGVVASDPLAFMNDDKNKLARVRAALRRLQNGKPKRAQDVRAFIRQVDRAVNGAPEPAETIEVQA